MTAPRYKILAVISTVSQLAQYGPFGRYLQHSPSQREGDVVLPEMRYGGIGLRW